MQEDLALVMVRDLQTLRREIELFPDDDAVWRTVPGIANSAGTLTLHVCGNLRHFVGELLGRTGFVRDRDAEFGTRGQSRAALAAQIQETIDVVGRVLRGLDPEVLGAPYPAAVGGVTLSTRRFLLHLASHLSFHLGQAGYLRRALTGDARTSGAQSVAALG